jgi:hypothetical protein
MPFAQQLSPFSFSLPSLSLLFLLFNFSIEQVRGEITKDFDIQFDHQFTGMERLIKLAGGSAMALFGAFSYIPQIVSLCTSIGLLILLSRHASCTVFFVDFWRPTALWMIVFSSVLSFAVIVTNTENTYYGLYSFLLGSVLILIAAVARWFRIARSIPNAYHERLNPLLEQLLMNRSTNNLGINRSPTARRSHSTNQSTPPPNL